MNNTTHVYYYFKNIDKIESLMKNIPSVNSVTREDSIYSRTATH